jgi:hypothetical protein
VNALALIAAVVCAAIAALLGFGAFNGTHILGWLSLAVGFTAVALLIPAALAVRGG